MTDPPRSPSAPLNVLLVCGDSMVRAELATLVESLTGDVIDPHAVTGLAAALLCAVARPDIVVLDVVDAGGEHDVLGITCASPTSAVVVFTARSDRRTTVRMVGAGASAVVAKSDGNSLLAVLSQLASRKAA